MTDRRSDKHGRLLDEEMEHETRSVTEGAPVESRADEAREKEPPDVDEPVPDQRVHGDRGMTGAGTLDPDEAERRADLARWLQPSVFPADRQTLAASARDLEAPEPILAALARLPEGVTFANVQAVWAELGGSIEERA